jgi:hypothetical protein
LKGKTACIMTAEKIIEREKKMEEIRERGRKRRRLEREDEEEPKEKKEREENSGKKTPTYLFRLELFAFRWILLKLNRF